VSRASKLAPFPSIANPTMFTRAARHCSLWAPRAAIRAANSGLARPFLDAGRLSADQ
jgi:hypothetical protein